MAKNNIPQTNPIEPTPFPTLTARQALNVGALACEHLLSGTPAIHTFDPADLELAAILLRQLAAMTVKGGQG